MIWLRFQALFPIGYFGKIEPAEFDDVEISLNKIYLDNLGVTFWRRSI